MKTPDILNINFLEDQGLPEEVFLNEKKQNN